MSDPTGVSIDGPKWNAAHAFSWGPGVNNTTLGNNAGTSIISASQCTFFGDSAGQSSTIAIGCTFVGYVAGHANIDGDNNTCIGFNAGTANTSGFSVTAVGYNAGWSNTTGSSNTFLGTQAGASNTTSNYNVYVGSFSGWNETGQANCYVGYKAGFVSTSGARNTYVGNSAAFEATSGYDNAFFGYNSGQNITTGYQNVFLGDGTVGIAGTNNSIAIGFQASATGTFGMALGSGVVNTSDNSIVVGGTTLVGVRFGGSGTVFSLGSGGVPLLVAGQSTPGGLACSTQAVADTSDCGYWDVGTLGTSGSEKRAAAMHAFLVGSAATSVTGKLLFYTTLSGTIAERMHLNSSGINPGASCAVVNVVKAGTPTDGDYTTPADGMIVVDSSGSKLWARVGGSWKGVAIA